MLKKLLACGSTAMSLLLVLFWLFSMWQSHVEDGAIALIAQGNALVTAGDPTSLQKALQDYKKAAVTFHDMGSSKEALNEGLAYYSIARAYHALKQDEQAIEAGQRALPLLAASPSRADEGDMYNNLGVYYINTKHPDKAMDTYAHARPLYEAAGLKDKVQKVVDMEGALRYDEATAAANKKDWAKARDACIQAQQFYHQAAKPTDEADAYHKLSLIYTAMGDAKRAAEARQQENGLRPAAAANPHK